MGYYLLKHEDKEIALFEIEGSSVKRVKVNIKNSKYIPIGINTDKELVRWLENRGIPITRKGLNRDLKANGVSTPFELMLMNKGLSLTDHYWISSLDEEYTWKDINLYENDFKSVYSLDLRDDKRSIAGKANFIPSTSVKGDLKKKWIIGQNGIRRLVKGNTGSSCRQSLCEVFATEIHKRQGKVQYTPYSLIRITSDKQEITGCECPNFTNKDIEAVHCIDILNSEHKPNEMSYYEFYIRLCNEKGIDIREFMEYQIMIDFIMSNSDRHLNNIAILRDSSTLEWLRPAPIFDSGNSMFYGMDYIPIDKALLKLEVNSFLSKEVKLLSYIRNRGLVDTRLLPSADEVYNLFTIDIVKDEITERLVKAYIKKIKYFEDFQNGANIWQYGYGGH